MALYVARMDSKLTKNVGIINQTNMKINTIIGIALILYAGLGPHDYLAAAVIGMAGGWILASK